MLKWVFLFLVLSLILLILWNTEIIFNFDSSDDQLKETVKNVEVMQSQENSEVGAEFKNNRFSLEALRDTFSNSTCGKITEHLKNIKDPSEEFNYFQLLLELSSLSKTSVINLKCEVIVSKFGYDTLRVNSQSWNQPEAVRFVDFSVRSLSRSGNFYYLSQLRQFLYELLEKYPEEYLEFGRKIEGHLCYALKNMGNTNLCKHLFLPQRNQQSQLFFEIGKNAYESKWRIVGQLLARVDKLTLVSGWDSYFYQMKGIYYYYIKEWEQALYFLKLSISTVNHGDLVTDTLDKYLYIIRIYRKLDRYSEALYFADQALARLQNEIEGPCFAGLALNMQRALVFHKLVDPPHWNDIELSFKSYMGDDPFGRDYQSAFASIYGKRKGYTPPYRQIDYKDVLEQIGILSK